MKKNTINYNLSLEDLPGEIWKDIPSWENSYQISNCGRVKSLEKIRFRRKGGNALYKTKILSFSYDRGYLGVNIQNNKFVKHYWIHRLVAIVFIPNPLNLPEVNHRDLNKSNNHAENLEWVTHKQNITHAWNDEKRYKTVNRGEKSGRSKLKECEVLEARRLFATGKITKRFLSKIFKVDTSTMFRILNRDTWTHI